MMALPPGGAEMAATAPSLMMETAFVGDRAVARRVLHADLASGGDDVVVQRGYAELLILARKTGFPPPCYTGPAMDPANLRSLGMSSCREEGAEQGFCHKACVCTAEEALRSKALAGVTDDERGKRLPEIAGRCIAAQK
jgi:hypothetical protein